MLTNRRRGVLTLACAALAIPACRNDDPQTDQPETASFYTADSPGVEGTQQGAMPMTPPLIPGIEVQLARLETAPPRALDSIRTAHKNLLADLVDAMQSDFRRAGLVNSPRFDALSDSVLDNVGGGTGTAESPAPEEVPEHVAQVRRLIELYQERIGATR